MRYYEFISINKKPTRAKCENCGLLQSFFVRYEYQCNCEKSKEWRKPI